MDFSKIELPKGIEGWVGAVLTVFFTGIIITSILRRVPALQDLARGV